MVAEKTPCRRRRLPRTAFLLSFSKFVKIFQKGRESSKSGGGILISLYALHARPEPLELEPPRAFKEFRNSMPYAGAFSTHTERILAPHIEKIEGRRRRIMERFQGRDAASLAGGDFSFILRPLPKISLFYIFYRADDDFQASAACFFSNALSCASQAGRKMVVKSQFLSNMVR